MNGTQTSRSENAQDVLSARFTPVFAPSQARRQLQASLVILAVVVTATLSVAFTGNLKPIHSKRAAVTLTYQQPGTLLRKKAQAPLVQSQQARPRG